uniref:Glycosyltransferase family 92 protein n=1 Tax=Panagrolaimus superbus TaxID=310955 RepID=A0A914Z5G2_9BILA
MRTELEFRNQATAHNDCYLLYREAADFIIVHDPDDLLFIKNMSNFWTTLAQLHLKNPFTAGFQFGRFNSYINISKSFLHTSISKSLESVRIGSSKVFLKSVFFTGGIENVNAHFAAYLQPNFKDTFLSNNSGIFVHIRNISYVDNLFNVEKDLVFEGGDKNITTYIDPNHLKNIKSAVKKRMSKFREMNHLRNLSLVNHYYKLIDDCYESVYYKYENTNGKKLLQFCPTHFHCKFPEIPGVNCVHAKQEFIRNDLKI